MAIRPPWPAAAPLAGIAIFRSLVSTSAGMAASHRQEVEDNLAVVRALGWRIIPRGLLADTALEQNTTTAYTE